MIREHDVGYLPAWAVEAVSAMVVNKIDYTTDEMAYLPSHWDIA